MESYLDTLKSELNAEEGSFLLKLRSDFKWDKTAFTRLVSAMRICCEQRAETDALPRWLAEGFWYFSTFVKETSSHPQFRRPYPQGYYQKAYERLEDLAYWFFRGESPYLEGSGFDEI